MLRPIKRFIFAAIALHAILNKDGLSYDRGDVNVFPNVAHDAKAVADCLIAELEKGVPHESETNSAV